MEEVSHPEVLLAHAYVLAQCLKFVRFGVDEVLVAGSKDLREDPKGIVGQVLVSLVHLLIVSQNFPDEHEKFLELDSSGHI